MTYKEWMDKQDIKIEGRGDIEFVKARFSEYLEELEGEEFDSDFIEEQIRFAFDISESTDLILLKSVSILGAKWRLDRTSPNHKTDD